MKYTLICSFIVCFFIFCLHSCAEDATENSNHDQSFLTAIINGGEERLYLKSELYAYATEHSDRFHLCGIVNNYSQRSLYIQLPVGFESGTYNFDDNVFAFVSDGDNHWSTRVGEGLGSITIEKLDGERFKGSFNFTAFDFDYDNVFRMLTVTNGTFDVLKR